MYPLKKITFFGREVSVLCQNENGPCPLLAISNVLLLERRLEIHPDLSLITLEELIQLLANRLIESNPPLEDEALRANQQKQMDSVIQLLPHLQYGLDVNVKFQGVEDFEYTEELEAFNLLGVSLYHGWLVDPADSKVAEAIGNQSYNQLVEKAITYRALSPELATRKAADSEWEYKSKDLETKEVDKPHQNHTNEEGNEDSVVVDITTSVEFESKEQPKPATQPQAQAQAQAQKPNNVPTNEQMMEGALINQFFTDTASQLTFHGLSELHSKVRERQLAVFFRNNHFSTLFKFDGNLYLLVTDCGYQDVPQVVWEKLDMINGDTEYYDSLFTNSTSLSAAASPVNEAPIDSDYLLAMAIQQEEMTESNAPAVNTRNNYHDQPVVIPAAVSAGNGIAIPPDIEVPTAGEVLVNPETGEPYSQEELAWMRRQQEIYGKHKTRRRSSSGNCSIL